MFYYFFLKYKNQFHKGNWKNILPIEWVGLLFFVIPALPVCFLGIVNRFNTIYAISFLIMVIDAILLSIHIKRREEKELDARAESYKSDKIMGIVDLCKEFNLYSSQGIDWLIYCCTSKIQDKRIPALSSYKSAVFPICTLAYGALISKVSGEELIRITIAILGLLLLFIWLGNMIKEIIMVVVYPDNDRYAQLKEELEYIKTQYSDIPENSKVLLAADIPNNLK